VLTDSPTEKHEAKIVEANAIVVIDREIRADMALPPYPATNVVGKFDHNTMQIGQSRVGF
jgi:hypothetical protein